MLGNIDLNVWCAVVVYVLVAYALHIPLLILIHKALKSGPRKPSAVRLNAAKAAYNEALAEMEQQKEPR